MTTITLKQNISVKEGPNFDIPTILIEAEAYDKIDISIKEGEEKKVAVQPSANAVSFLLITSNTYDEKLTFTIGDKSDINFSYPQLYVGEDVIRKLLGDVKEITFKCEKTNPPTTPTVFEISILAGRNLKNE